MYTLCACTYIRSYNPRSKHAQPTDRHHNVHSITGTGGQGNVYGKTYVRTLDAIVRHSSIEEVMVVWCKCVSMAGLPLMLVLHSLLPYPCGPTTEKLLCCRSCGLHAVCAETGVSTWLTAHRPMMAITMKIIATPTATRIGQNSKEAVNAVTSGFSSKVSCDEGTTSAQLVHTASYYARTWMGWHSS